ncbi:MAG TPA: acyl-CoA dehydrogenase [Acidimicrobiia bacterium]|nr:acyl-CoA dehydrogenase [Acidimicrobiia bacterium]
MSIAITDTHRELADVARSFLDANKARAAARDLLESPDEARPPFWDELAALGWLGLHLPEQHGGSGYGLAELVVVLEELGRATAPGPFLPTVLSSAVIARCGTDAQQAALLPGLADGSRAGALATAGAAARSGSTVSGDAGLVLGGGLADVLLVPVGDDVVVLDASTPGVDVNVPTNLDPTRRAAKVTLHEVAVDDSRVLTGAAAVARDLTLLLTAAEAAGGAQDCVDASSAYAKEREQFGRPIGMYQAVKHHCANMLVAAELATAAVWDAARSADGPADQFSLACATAASLAVPAYLKNAQLNIQIHGGIGFTWEHDGHLILRRASTLAALVDARAAAAAVAGHAVDGVTRDLDFTLPPEAEEYRDATRVAAQEIAALEGAEQLTRLIDTGYVQPHWPKPWGREAKALEQLVIEAEFGAAGLQPVNYGITGWIMLTMLSHASEDQIARWIRPTLERELNWCQLFSEPDAGSDAAGIRTKGVRVDGGWEVTGQKVWTSGAQFCTHGLATVRTDPDVPKHAGITTMVIDMHADGVEVRPLREATGAAMFNEVFFDKVFVPDDDVVGQINDGWTVARATLGNERVSIGGGGSGFGVPVVELFGAQGRPAALAAEVGRFVAQGSAMRALNLRRVERAVANAEPGPEGNVTKLLSAEQAQWSADLGLALLGPDTVVLEGSGALVANALLFTRALSIAGGTSEITRNQIGERILGLPRDPLIK